nr:hypothetical protein [Metamycoplasma hominis]
MFKSIKFETLISVKVSSSKNLFNSFAKNSLSASLTLFLITTFDKTISFLTASCNLASAFAQSSWSKIVP